MPARAQTFPGALIRIIVPAAPGGGTDILARAMSTQLQTLWGQTVIVENRSGAAGLIGTKAVIASPGDGHTLLMAATSAIMSLATNTPAPFEITRDLAPVTLVSAPPYILVAHPSVPAKNAAELIAYAKQNPGKLSYGSSGAGAASHLSGALFAQMAGIEMLHVPYRGMGAAVPDLLGGRIQLLFAPAITVTPHIAAGTLRVIGTTGATRSTLFPDFPTIAESGLPKYDSLGWFGLFAPGTTPPAVVGADQRGRAHGAALRRSQEAAGRAGRRARAEHAAAVHGVREFRHHEMAGAREEGGDQAGELIASVEPGTR